MLALIARIPLLAAATVPSWVVARHAPDFGAMQMTAAVLPFMALVAVPAFLPTARTSTPGRWSKPQTLR